MAAGGSGQAACAYEIAKVGGGVVLLSECQLGGGTKFRYEASIGNQSEEACRHGQMFKEHFVRRFEDKNGAAQTIADATTGCKSGNFVRIGAMEVLPTGERLVCGMLALLKGNKAVIPLAATAEEYERRGHMTHLYRKVAASFLSSRGVDVVAVEADEGFWTQDAFGLEELINKGGGVNECLDFSEQDVKDLRAMRTVCNVPLLAGRVVAAETVPLPSSVARAASGAKLRRSRGMRPISRERYQTAGKVELHPDQHLVLTFFGGNNRPTVGLWDTAGEGEGKAVQDLVFLVAARACGNPAPKLLCPDSSLSLAEEEKLEAIGEIKTWEDLKRELKGWRRSGALRSYLQRVASGLQQEGREEGEGAHQQRDQKTSRRSTKRRRSEQPSRRQQRAAGTGASEQPTSPEAQQGDVQAAQGQPAAAEKTLLSALLDSVCLPAATEADLTEALVGTYIGHYLGMEPTKRQEQEASLLAMLQRPLFKTAVAMMRKTLDG